MDALLELSGLIKGWVNITLFKIGTAPVTLWTIVSLVVLFVLLLWLTKRLKNWIVLSLLGGRADPAAEAPLAPGDLPQALTGEIIDRACTIGSPRRRRVVTPPTRGGENDAGRAARRSSPR